MFSVPHSGGRTIKILYQSKCCKTTVQTHTLMYKQNFNHADNQADSNSYMLSSLLYSNAPYCME